MKISIQRFKGNEVYLEEVSLGNFLAVEFDTEDGHRFALSFVGDKLDVRTADGSLVVLPRGGNNVYIGSLERQ